jgi:hypothetical protein
MREGVKMSRKDTYHSVVKQKLIEEGWTITHDPYIFFNSTPQLATDLGAERLIAADKGREKIVVEVKSFLNLSQVADLEKAIGQYNLYIWHLEEQDPDRALYVAVPSYAYEGIFSMPVGQMAVTRLQMKLIVYAASGEGALQWITP